MTLLNRASDGLASVLVVIVRALRELGPTDRDELVDLLSPGTLGDEKIRATLTRWQQLGLFVTSGNDVALADGYLKTPYKFFDDPTLSTLRRLTFELVLREGESEKGDLVDDAVLGSWWLLTIDPFRDVIHSWSDAQRILARDYPKHTIIQNDTRWPGLLEWAHLWGLIQPPSTSAALIPCPAEAILWFLSELLPTKDPLPLKAFLTALNRRLPVLPILADGAVENALSPKLPVEGRPLDQRGARLSVSLSLALRTLKESKRIQLKNFDTGDKWYLTDVEGETITHLARQS